MIEIIQREFIYLWYFFSIQFEQIFKYWVFGMVLGSFISVFGKEKLHALFAALRRKRLGVFGIVPAVLLGITSPLCMYGTIPIAASFAGKEMEQDADFQSMLAAFMMSSILLNPQLLVYTAALGMPVLIIRFAICFFCGIAAGIVIRIFFMKKQFFDFSRFYSSKNSNDTDINLFMRYLKNLYRNIKITAPFFLIGIFLSVIFQRYAPKEAFAALFGSGGFGILMAATIGVPLYVCGGGTIPLLQSWLQSGMSMGAASAFMITGPAAKITNLGALKIVLGTKHFLCYVLFIAIFSLLCGFIVNGLSVMATSKNF
jgi:hypothetical protein